MFIRKVSYISSKLGYIIVSSFLLLIVVMIFVRMLTPILNEQRETFEHWSGKLLDAPVQVKRLEAYWKGLEPGIRLKNIEILGSDRKQVIFHADELQITISLWKTFFSWQLQPSTMKIIGVHLVVNQVPDGHFRVQSFNENQKRLQKQSNATDLTKKISQTLFNAKEGDNATTQQKHSDVLLTWLFSRSRLSLKNVIIDFKRPHVETWSVALRKLNLVNHGSQHILRGVAQILDPKLMSVRVGLSLTGDVRDREHLKATLYLKLKHVLLEQWLSHRVFYDSQINKGILNGEFWLKWREGRWQSIQGLVDAHQLNLKSKFFKQPLDVERFSGNLLWKLRPKGWQLSGSQILFDIDHIIWPKNQFTLQVDQKEDKPLQQKFWIHYINLEDIQHFLSQDRLSKLIPKFKELSKLQPAGEGWDSFFVHRGRLDDWNDFQLKTNFKHLKMRQWKQLPGINNLSGTLQLGPLNGELFIDSTETVFDLDTLFKQPLFMKALSGKVRWYRDIEKTWVIKAEDVTVDDDYVALYGHFGMLWPQGSINPTLSLLAGVDLYDAKRVKDYLPIGILSQPLTKWLDQAFPGEGNASGTVIFRGNVREFPFDHHEGIFIVDSEVEHVDLHYAKNWPDLYDINGKLVFFNRSMLCLADTGKIQKTKVQSVRASIPHMGRGELNVLYVDGDVKSDAKALLDFVHYSPLAKIARVDLSRLEVKGKTQLDLSLSFPLKEIKKTKVKGKIDFSDVHAAVKECDLELDQIKGTLFFEDRLLSSESLQADLFGKPTDFSIETVGEDQEKPFTQISFQNHLDLGKIKKHFRYSMPFIKGETDFQASINLYTAKDDARQDNLVISSDLSGIEVNLPMPLTKVKEEIIPSKMTLFFDRDKSRDLIFQFGNQLSTALSFKTGIQTLKLFSANLHFGSGSAKIQKEKGLLIDGFLPKFNWKVWKNYLSRKIGKYKPQQSLEEFLRAIHITIGEIKLLEQPFVNATFRIRPRKSTWEVDVNSKNIVGNVLVIPTTLEGLTIFGNFTRLHIVSDPALENRKIEPSQLPVLNIKADDFQYQKWHFGKLDLLTKHEGGTFRVQHLSVTSPEFSAALQGNWRKLKAIDSYKSEIWGEVSSQNISGLFKKWQIHSNLIGSTGYVKVHFNWMDALYKPQFQKMNGNVSLKLGKGRIVQLGEKAESKLDLGFILSLLSLHRIIQMDFDQLTQDGYGFDKMKSSLNLQNGKISTDHTYFDGSIARVDVEGSLNAILRTLNLSLKITPYITSSLPVIATLTGGPVVGAVTWVADKLFGKKVSKMSRYRYKVTGPWNKPIIKGE